MKHLFIVNPKAGKGKSLNIISQIKEAFKDINEEYIIEITKWPGHATELVRNYVSKEDYRVYSVGGDGTLNEVLNGMVNSESCIGVIPSGSGNDFIRNICGNKLPDNIIKSTINGKVKMLDLGKIDDRYFINISSVGIDAEVVNNAKNLKAIPLISGKIAYILSAVITIFKYKYKNIQLEIDGKGVTLRSTLLAVANGKYYGGGMKVAPFADLQDGLLDICVINSLSRVKMLLLFPKLIKGKHDEIKEVSFLKGRKVQIDANEEVYISIDGEIIRKKKFNLEIIPKGIKFIIP